MGVDNPDRAGL